MSDSPYKKQQKLTSLQFIIDIPSFIAVVASALVSQSLLVWLDLVNSLGYLISETLIILQSRKLSKNLKYEYNYGVGKVESLTTILSEGIAIGGLLCIIVVSCMQLISPEKPSDLLIYVCIMKIVNVIIDYWFVFQQGKLYKETKSNLIHSEYVSNIGSLIFDLSELVSLVLIWLFRDYKITWYITPALSIIISVILCVMNFKIVKQAVNELTDKTLPEDMQMKILKVMTAHNDEYDTFDSIRSHESEATVLIDIVIKFRDETTFSQISKLHDELQEELSSELGNCTVSLLL